MDLGGVALGVFGIFWGLRTLSKGVETLGNGLKGEPAVERDPGRRGSMGSKVGQIAYSPGQRVQFREVRDLSQRINAIRDRVRLGRADPRVIAWSRRQVTKKCPGRGHGIGQWCVPEKDTKAEIAAIFYGMRRDIRYTSDPRGIDLYVNPARTLEHRAGDCDDYAALGAAALASIGIASRLKVVRTRESPTWNHIYLLANTDKNGEGRWVPLATGRRMPNGRWVALDASVPVKPGWEVPASQVAEARVFEVA